MARPRKPKFGESCTHECRIDKVLRFEAFTEEAKAAYQDYPRWIAVHVHRSWAAKRSEAACAEPPPRPFWGICIKPAGHKGDDGVGRHGWFHADSSGRTWGGPYTCNPKYQCIPVVDDDGDLSFVSHGERCPLQLGGDK
jgi:hypothetical protein